MAVGVARPKAQGQAITNTDINIVKAKVAVLPVTYHTIPATAAIPMTIGTKYPEITSAILAIGALDPCASSTNLIICARAVSLPTFVASK